MAGCRTGDNASKKLQIPVRRTDYLEVERAVIPGSVILRVNVEIVGIDCRALIKQHGSLHCVTMQYPAGTLQEDFEQ